MPTKEKQEQVKLRLPPVEYAALQREARKRKLTNAALVVLMFRAAAAEFFDDF